MGFPLLLSNIHECGTQSWQKYLLAGNPTFWGWNWLRDIEFSILYSPPLAQIFFNLPQLSILNSSSSILTAQPKVKDIWLKLSSKYRNIQQNVLMRRLHHLHHFFQVCLYVYYNNMRVYYNNMCVYYINMCVYYNNLCVYYNNLCLYSNKLHVYLNSQHPVCILTSCVIMKTVCVF